MSSCVHRHRWRVRGRERDSERELVTGTVGRIRKKWKGAVQGRVTMLMWDRVYRPIGHRRDQIQSTIAISIRCRQPACIPSIRAQPWKGSSGP